jgi:prepilin-type N-terminal cleavage/methylation domain-containing protein
MKKKYFSGFTLFELLIVIAIIGILATITVSALNPTRQLAKAHDTERRADLFSILSAVYQYASEHSGELPDTDGDPETSNFPTAPTCIGNQAPCFDLASAGADDTIIPDYMAQMLFDPKTGDEANTEYLIHVDENGRLVASATGETTDTITVTR